MGFHYVPQAKVGSLESLITAIIPTWVERERPGEGRSVGAGALDPTWPCNSPAPGWGQRPWLLNKSPSCFMYRV